MPPRWTRIFETYPPSVVPICACTVIAVLIFDVYGLIFVAGALVAVAARKLDMWGLP